MRRKEKEITDRAVMEEVLREAQIGRLATCSGGEPYVVPVNFVYADGMIYFHGHREGKKMGNISRNPRVCFEVDSGEVLEADRPCDYNFEYRSVVVQGFARVVEDPERALRALRRLVDKYAFGKGRTLERGDLERHGGLVVVEVEVGEMTGKMSPA